MDPWPKIIVHADMDAFYAAVEQLDNPSLRGKPILVGPKSTRGVVLTASYEARPFGVGSAMPVAEARRRCPEAIMVSPRFDRYQEISSQIMAVFADFFSACGGTVIRRSLYGDDRRRTLLRSTTKYGA